MCFDLEMGVPHEKKGFTASRMGSFKRKEIYIRTGWLKNFEDIMSLVAKRMEDCTRDGKGREKIHLPNVMGNC